MLDRNFLGIWFVVLAVLVVTGSSCSFAAGGRHGSGGGKHIVLVSGDEEYRSEEALPQLAKILAERHVQLEAKDAQLRVVPLSLRHVLQYEEGVQPHVAPEVNVSGGQRPGTPRHEQREEHAANGATLYGRRSRCVHPPVGSHGWPAP